MPGTLQQLADIVNDTLSPAFEDLADTAMPLIKESWNESLKPTFQRLSVRFLASIVKAALSNFVLDWAEKWDME